MDLVFNDDDMAIVCLIENQFIGGPTRNVAGVALERGRQIGPLLYDARPAGDVTENFVGDVVGDDVPSTRSPDAGGSFLDAERLILEPISENASGASESVARQIGRAKLSSCPSGPTMWKYRSPHDPSFGENSGVRPADIARAYCASTSST
jgi:hypothetical protein